MGYLGLDVALLRQELVVLDEVLLQHAAGGAGVLHLVQETHPLDRTAPRQGHVTGH